MKHIFGRQFGLEDDISSAIEQYVDLQPAYSTSGTGNGNSFPTAQTGTGITTPQSAPVVAAPIDWQQESKTSIPTLIVTDFILGHTPTSERLKALSDFCLLQFNSYAANGVGDPSIGPYEALGLGLAGTPEFSAFAGGSDTSFVASVYQTAFGRAATVTQVDHFLGQLSYFAGLYVSAGVALAQASLQARGAVLGQILGFASKESGNAFVEAAGLFLLDASDGNARYSVDLLSAYGAHDHASPGVISVAPALLNTFTSTTAAVTFDIANAQFTDNLDNVFLTINGKVVGSTSLSVSADGSHLVLKSGSLSEGKNDIALFTTDQNGKGLADHIVVWAGSATLTVHVVDQSGQPLIGADVTATLTEDPTIKFTAKSGANGLVVFSNLPNRDITIEGVISGNFGSVGVLGGDNGATLELTAIGAPSAVTNNDFSLDLSGWNVAGAPVSLVAHDEGASSPATALPSFFAPRDAPPAQTSYAASSLDLNAAPSAGTNKDLVLTTSGEGPQKITYTFKVQPSTESVSIRFKFVTSEIPGGYFGSQYNDYYTVTLRDSLGNVISESASMNGLGLASFDSSGATSWKQLTLAPGQLGPTIQVEVVVANVGDGAYDSKVIVDLVKTGALAIKAFALKDIDNTDLHYLSASKFNPYFGGHTDINGTMTIEGAETDSISSISLQIISGGQVIALASLSDAAKAILIGHQFGASHQLSFSTSSLLFELSNSEAGKIPVAKDGSVLLRLMVTTASGEQATKDFGNVDILTYLNWTDTFRFTGRDENRGGDDWATPGTIALLNHYKSKIIVGDISNMNGGTFAPDHIGHETGREVDGWYAGYNDLNAATAQTMLSLLNDATYGHDIIKVLVDYDPVATDPFYAAIKDVKLADGRSAVSVIRPDADHNTHFHWYLDI